MPYQKANTTKPMFTVIYSFKIKINKEVTFEKAWGELTTLIYEYEGSLGSRLHKKSDKHYIAYAQWPDKETWENSGGNLPKESLAVRERMKNSCEEIEVLYKLEVVEDLLKTKIKQP